MHQAIFPNLAKMVRDYLGILTSSAPVKRVFSSGRDLISIRHNSLNEESIEAYMCLRSWYENDI